MKKPLYTFLFLLLLIGCAEEKEKLAFTEEKFQKQLLLPGGKDTTIIKVILPVATNKSIAADSINKKVFAVVKEIVYFGDKPFTSKDYNLLLESFIVSYKQFVHDFPDYNIPWEASLKGKVLFQTDSILNIQIDHYSFTGGAHGNGGLRSILINPNTGKTIANKDLFINENDFKAFAEKQFRIKYKIPANGSINATGFQFEDEKFHLPLNIFYTEKGLLLYYNQYEAAAYVEGPKELFLPYEMINAFLKIK